VDLGKKNEVQTLFRSILQQEMDEGDVRGGGYVPITEYSVFCLLAAELARSARDAGQDLLVLMDGHTAKRIDPIKSAVAVASDAYIYGDRPEQWDAAAAANVRTLTEPLADTDRFLIALSPSFHLAMVAEMHVDETNREAGLQGIWTAVRPRVTQLAEKLLAAHGDALPTAMNNPMTQDGYANVLACAMRMTTLATEQLAMRQRTIAQDRSDLAGVLDILKAISSRRRAHDILYCFVEKIAEIIQTHRCSVVRVWGHETKGHVLASHEDRRIRDLSIDLDKYPEIYRAMETGKTVVVNDVRHDPLTRRLATELRAADIASIMVIPIVLFDQNVGSFLLRALRRDGMFSLRETNFCEIVTEAAANALERAHLFESIQLANERLERLAVTDGLTGLFNHRYFRERLDDEFERAKRYGLPLSCLILDLDNFKQVNDTYGHLAGDSVLRELAARTIQRVRKSDIVARYGGEEFVVIMPQTGSEGARSQAERIRKRISETPFSALPPEHEVTVSIGVSVLEPGMEIDCEALIRIADTALYQSKQDGKNRVTVGTQKGALS